MLDYPGGELFTFVAFMYEFCSPNFTKATIVMNG
jgi:hypothetical protein